VIWTTPDGGEENLDLCQKEEPESPKLAENLLMDKSCPQEKGLLTTRIEGGKNEEKTGLPVRELRKARSLQEANPAELGRGLGA